MSDGVGKNPSKQSNGTAGRSFTSANPSEPPFSCRFCFTGCFAGGDVMHEGINVFPSDRGDVHRSEKWLDVPLNTTSVDQERARLFC
jgi:hypothetical protein